MKNKIVILLAMLTLTVIIFLPKEGFAKAPEMLSQQEIDNILEERGSSSPAIRVTTLDELNAIDNYYEENSNAKEENIETVLEKLNLEHIELVRTEEVNNTNKITPFNTFPNAGSAIFRNVDHDDKLFYATLIVTNFGIDSIDQIGGYVYGYAILPNKDYSVAVLKEYFNETSVKPFLDRKVGDYNFAHHKNRASFMAEYVVREGNQIVKPTPAGVSFRGMQ